ncbi:hypothetical protein [Massilia sp. DWR3-1-1]|uniref:hypothetical protein n=1 Tax=Massilia sp. DWR3-1-1 TaxID=2804559 RepID=UPI003CF4BE31
MSVVFYALRRNLTAFVVIVLVLWAGNWARDEWHTIQSTVTELPSLERSHREVVAYRGDISRQVESALAKLSAISLAQIDSQIGMVDDSIARTKREQTAWMALSVKHIGALPQRLGQAAKLELLLEILAQERNYLIEFRPRAEMLLHRQAALARLERLRLAQLAASAAYQSALGSRPVGQLASLLSRLPWTQAHAAQTNLVRLKQQSDMAHAQWTSQQQLLASLPALKTMGAFRIDAQRVDAAVAPLTDQLARARRLATGSFAVRAYQAVSPLIPAALAVLAGALLVPLAIRAIFYFLLAPAASRLAPIVIGMPNQQTAFSLGRQGTPPRDGSRISAVSQKIRLAPSHELLIRQGYCQSQPADVRIVTQWLFSKRYVLSSVASYLWLLNRMRSAHAVDIVVSSTVDPLEEVALLDIAAGESFVLQPRSLVGILHQSGRRPRIRSHWRLGTAHAWLTLQLRYLAFEGPATLIVKGCRGVRLESAEAGRQISQDATLGFSGNAAYSTTRAEPFIPYARGRQTLLQDRFAGQNAYYLYEEVPRNGQPGQARRNPFELLVDAGLKALGI